MLTINDWAKYMQLYKWHLADNKRITMGTLTFYAEMSETGGYLIRDEYKRWKQLITLRDPVIDPEEWFNPIFVVLHDDPEWKIPPRWQNIPGSCKND